METGRKQRCRRRRRKVWRLFFVTPIYEQCPLILPSCKCTPIKEVTQCGSVSLIAIPSDNGGRYLPPFQRSWPLMVSWKWAPTFSFTELVTWEGSSPLYPRRFIVISPTEVVCLHLCTNQAGRMGSWPPLLFPLCSGYHGDHPTPPVR